MFVAITRRLMLPAIFMLCFLCSNPTGRTAADAWCCCNSTAIRTMPNTNKQLGGWRCRCCCTSPRYRCCSKAAVHRSLVLFAAARLPTCYHQYGQWPHFAVLLHSDEVRGAGSVVFAPATPKCLWRQLVIEKNTKLTCLDVFCWEYIA